MNLRVRLYTSTNSVGQVNNVVLETLDRVDDRWLLTIYRLRRKWGTKKPAYWLKRHFKRRCKSEHAASQYAQQLAQQFGWSNWPSSFIDQAQRDSYLPTLRPVLPLNEGSSISVPAGALLIRDCPTDDECWVELVPSPLTRRCHDESRI